jgi:hypothetical protein
MKQKILYSTRKMCEYNINCCHSEICEINQRKKCNKVKSCLINLFDGDKRDIAKVSVYKNVGFGDKTWKKIEKEVSKWRKESYLKCKPVEFIIKRHRLG